MKFVILGAGALGSILAAHLTRAGHDVTLIARGARAQYLADNGITLTGVESFIAKCNVATDAAAVGAVDYLVLAVKTYDTPGALDIVGDVDTGAVLSLQNGVLKNEQLTETFGKDRVLGSTCMTGGKVEQDGSILYTVKAPFYVGELSGAASKRCDDYAAALAESGLAAETTDEILSMEWTKFVGWSGLSVVSILTRLDTFRFLIDPDAARIAARITRETAQIPEKLGIPLTRRVHIAAANLVGCPEDKAVKRLIRSGEVMREQPVPHRQSMLQDLDRGRRIEVEETIGYTVAKAAEMKIAIPTVETCYRIMSALNRTLGQAAS